MRYILGFLLFSIGINAQTSAITMADSLFSYGKYNKAIKVLETANNKNEAYPKIASNYMALGNYSKAISYYQKSIELEPGNQLNLFQLAKLYNSTKAYVKAKESLLYLIDLDYKNPNYHYQLGKVHNALQDEFSAQSRFKSAFDLDQSNQKAIYELAKYAFKKRLSKSFNNYLEIGLKNDSENKNFISLKAQNFYLKEDYKNALIQFEKLLELNENTQFVYEKISACYDKLYLYKNAVKYLELALVFDKTNVDYMYSLGSLYQKLEKFEKAEIYYTLALKIRDQPLDKEYSNLGIVLNRQKKYKEAISVFKRALKDSPNSEVIHFYLVNTKLKYYKTYQSKVDVINVFQKRFPESVFNKSLSYQLKQLVSEDFHKED